MTPIQKRNKIGRLMKYDNMLAVLDAEEKVRVNVIGDIQPFIDELEKEWGFKTAWHEVEYYQPLAPFLVQSSNVKKGVVARTLQIRRLPMTNKQWEL